VQEAEAEVKRIKHERAKKKRLETEFQKKVSHARHERDDAKRGVQGTGGALVDEEAEERKVKELESLMGVESEEEDNEELDLFDDHPVAPVDPLASLVEWIAGADPEKSNAAELMEVAHGEGAQHTYTAHHTAICICSAGFVGATALVFSAHYSCIGPGSLEIRKALAAKTAARENEQAKKKAKERRKREHAMTVGGR
jgi:hypothetical protein